MLKNNNLEELTIWKLPRDDNQDSVVLAWRKTNRSLEYNCQSRNKSIYLWSVGFFDQDAKFNVGKSKSSTRTAE